MSKIRRFMQGVFSSIIILSLSISVIQPKSASAQGGDGIKRQVNAESGKVSFIGPESGRSVSAARALGIAFFARPADPALALAKRFAPEFGLQNAERDLSVKKSDQLDQGRLMVRYQQNHQGIPVMGGELIVNTNENGDLYSMNGEVSPNLSLSTEPTIDSEQARQTALQAAAKWYQKSSQDFLVSEPELWIFDESLLRASSRPVELVWRMEVTSVDKSQPVRELVLINAQRGNISLHFNQIDTAWHSAPSDSFFEQARTSNRSITSSATTEDSLFLTFSPLINTYTANGTSSLPGSFLCNQSQPNCTNGSDPHADAAHKYAIGTFNLYDTQHNRNSINGSGMTIASSVHYCDELECPYYNAFWNGTQIVYGDGAGWPLADDVVAHEFTHGVTQYESNLFYYYQSGAINESFSDLWGEYYDQNNGLGDDSSFNKWFIGEDISDWYISRRNMADPPYATDPDKMSNYYYYKFDDDNGGVHTNSGINNKAVYLMVDGDTFNGKTVSPLGWTKTLAIYYEVQTNLLISGSDYSDLYYALQQACSTLIGQKGITAADCQEVKDAIDAVEMNTQPEPDFNTDAPLCDSQQIVNTIFFDNLENGTSNWTFTKTGIDPRWQYDSPYGTYAHSGFHSLYADDYPAAVTDATAKLISLVIPSNAYLHFAHAYGFEYGYTNNILYNYDGGVFEYSNNGGSTWLDAGSLIDYNGYKGTIFNGAGNPLSGRSAFVNSSHGYISTRLNLASLVGQTVSFRWRMGLDGGFSGGILGWGWWVDDVQIYNCRSTISGNAEVGGVTLSYTDGTAKTATSSGNGNYSFPVSYDWSGTVTPSHACFTFNPASRNYSNVTANQTSQNYTATIKPASGCANVNVSITGANQGNYGVPPGQSIFDRYKMNGGPVHVESTNGSPIFTSQRAIFGSSFNSIVGYPGDQLTTDYWFTSYDDAGMITYLVIGNPHPSNTAQVDVYIGGNLMGHYSIAPGQRVFPRYGINAGPVHVVSTNGVNLFTSERTKFGNSFNEVMGYPGNQLTTDYWFTSYDDVGMITYLVVGNPHPSQTAEVDVYIGGNKKNATPYQIAPGQRIFPRYGINSGPVRVVSTNGVNIFTSERTKFGNTFNEVMGYPGNQAHTEFWFTSYDDLGMISYLVIGNPHISQTALVDVYIGGVKQNASPYSLAPGQRMFQRYSVNGGPVRVVSTNGVSVFASERSKYLSSFNEILGMAGNQLATDYWFTSYDDVGMTAYLVIGAP